MKKPEPSAEDLVSYTAAIARLVEVGRRIASSQWKPTQRRAQLQKIQKQANALITSAPRAGQAPLPAFRAALPTLLDLVDAGPAWSDLEDECKGATSRLREWHSQLSQGGDRFDTFDKDATPAVEPPAEAQTFDPALELQTIAEAVARHLKALPAPNAQPAQRYLAEVFLHLRYRHGFGRPNTYTYSEDVKALDNLLRQAKAGPRYKNAEQIDADTLELTQNLLTTALQSFDPASPPAGYDELT